MPLESSPRAGQPFATINCSALPETLFESELFGYERGAFTGAHAASPGRLQAASETAGEAFSRAGRDRRPSMPPQTVDPPQKKYAGSGEEKNDRVIGRSTRKKSRSTTEK